MIAVVPIEKLIDLLNAASKGLIVLLVRDAKLERIFPGAAIAFATMLESVDGAATPVLGRIFLGLNAVEVFSKTVLS